MDAEENDRRQEQFDRWLDAALRARVYAQPRMGLEDRVLARIATDPPRKTFSWIPLVAAIAAVVVVSAALFVTYSSRQSLKSATAIPSIVRIPPVSEAPAIQAKSGLPGTAGGGKVMAHRVARARAPEVGHVPDHEQALPILATFPAAAPQTPQERLLVELARGASAKDLADFSETLVPLKDIEISSLQIEPLDNATSPH
jgi:hypothetical protein